MTTNLIYPNELKSIGVTGEDICLYFISCNLPMSFGSITKLEQEYFSRLLRLFNDSYLFSYV